jgi:hypothetical protein
MKDYNFNGHWTGNFNRKDYSIVLGKELTDIFRAHDTKSVILTPSKLCVESSSDYEKPLITEFDLVRLYPDFFKMFRYSQTKEGYGAEEVRLKRYKNYSKFTLPSGLRDHLQFFSDELKKEIVIIAPFSEFLEIWDKDAFNHFERIYEPSMGEVASELHNAWIRNMRKIKSGTNIF